jgi:hypothetical protein
VLIQRPFLIFATRNPLMPPFKCEYSVVAPYGGLFYRGPPPLWV